MNLTNTLFVHFRFTNCCVEIDNIDSGKFQFLFVCLFVKFLFLKWIRTKIAQYSTLSRIKVLGNTWLCNTLFWTIKSHGSSFIHIAHKDSLPHIQKSRVVILVAGFSLSSHRYGHPTPLRSGMVDPYGFPGKKEKALKLKSTTLRQSGKNSEESVGR